MNLNRKVGFLLDSGLTPEFIVSLNEGTINALYERMNKKETKEITMVSKDDTTTQQRLKTEKKPFEVYEDTEIEQDPFGDYEDTQKLQQRGPSDYGDNPKLDKEMDDYDADGMGIMEKFESKAQQGLFWARCNKCENKNCKWCKMAKEFSKSTTKKQYEKMPEKKHPEKTVKYKKNETKENFTFKDYFDKIGSVTASQLGKNINKSMRPTFENVLKNKLENLIKESLMPTITKKDLLNLLKKRINEDFYFGESEMLEDFKFMNEPAIKEPAIKPKTPTEKPKEKPRRKPERITPYENPETRPQGEYDEEDIDMMDLGFMNEPAIKEPAIKPKTPTEKPKEKPRRKPERITPYENPETRPQGEYDEEDIVMERLYRKIKKIL